MSALSSPVPQLIMRRLRRFAKFENGGLDRCSGLPGFVMGGVNGSKHFMVNVGEARALRISDVDLGAGREVAASLKARRTPLKQIPGVMGKFSAVFISSDGCVTHLNPEYVFLFDGLTPVRLEDRACRQRSLRPLAGIAKDGGIVTMVMPMNFGDEPRKPRK